MTGPPCHGDGDDWERLLANRYASGSKLELAVHDIDVSRQKSKSILRAQVDVVETAHPAISGKQLLDSGVVADKTRCTASRVSTSGMRGAHSGRTRASIHGGA